MTANHYLAEKDLGSGRKAWIVPLTFNRARIIVGQAGSDWVEDGW